MNFFAAGQPILSAYAESDFFGKCIFIALFTLSVVCWVILVQKSLEVRNVRRLATAFTRACEQTEGSLLALSLDLLPKGLRSAPHPYAKVFLALKQKTLEILNKNHYFAEDKGVTFLSQSDIELVESHVLIAISTESKKLEKNLFILATIRNLAPFLGLLGTVWGILVTFSQLEGGASAASNSAIIGALSMALATTVLGLVIAIPALISYNYLRNAFNYLSSDMEDFLYKLLSKIELQYRKPLSRD